MRLPRRKKNKNRGGNSGEGLQKARKSKMDTFRIE
jgi:hypothetical protein